MVLLLALALLSWNQIDVLCVVRDAAGRPAANLRADQFQVFDAGEQRPVLSLARDNTKPEVIRLENPASLYDDVYLAVMRRFDTNSARKILVISGRHPDQVTDVRRWELAFLALRQHVVIFGLGPSDSTVTSLAAETGGRVAPSWAAIQADLDAQYRIVASPTQLPPNTGRFHALEIRAPKGFNVQAPRDYYITPPW
jgi:hypothetical protein